MKMMKEFGNNKKKINSQNKKSKKNNKNQSCKCPVGRYTYIYKSK